MARAADGDVDRQVDEAAEALYALRPDEFTAARDDLAKQARTGGSAAVAAAIKKLRRPTVAGWLVNMVARERADDLQAVLDLGADMRAAQTGLDGDEIRRLSAQRRTKVAKLVGTAKALAAELGHPVGDAVLRDVERTVQAALGDEDVAEQVAAGRVAAALAADPGYGLDLSAWMAAPKPNLRAVPSSGDTKSTGGTGGGDDADPDSDGDADRERSAAERRKDLRRQADAANLTLAAARRTLVKRHRAAEQAAERVDAAAERVAEVEAELDRARATLASAESDRDDAAAAETAAEDEIAAAQDEVDAAESALADGDD